MIAITYESSGQPLPHVSEEGHSSSSPVLCFSIVDGLLLSSFCLQDCKIVMLTTYVTNLIPPSSPRMQRKTGYTPLQWLYCKHEWPQNSPDLNLLDYHVWGAMLKAYHKLDITSCTSKPSTIEELQTRRTGDDLEWPSSRNLWQGLSRTFVSDCKHACSRLADTEHSMWLTLY